MGLERGALGTWGQGYRGEVIASRLVGPAWCFSPQHSRVLLQDLTSELSRCKDL